MLSNIRQYENVFFTKYFFNFQWKLLFYCSDVIFHYAYILLPLLGDIAKCSMYIRINANISKLDFFFSLTSASDPKSRLSHALLPFLLWTRHHQTHFFSFVTTCIPTVFQRIWECLAEQGKNTKETMNWKRSIIHRSTSPSMHIFHK